MDISFDNTKVAFSGKSDKDLNRAYFLFSLIGNNFLVKAGKTFTQFALKMNLPISGLLRATIFRQFCGGETIENSNYTIKSLNKYNIGTILDYSVEGKESEKDFEHTVDEIIATIKKSKENPAIPFSVFKVTGIARFSLLEKANKGIDNLSASEKEEFKKVLNRINKICKAAFDAGTPVFIDAEESWIQDTIDNAALDMMRKYNKEKVIVYNTLQMYRKGRLVYFKILLQKAIEESFYIGMKIVRGAYMEKERERAEKMGYPSPIQDTKAASDKDYDAALEFSMNNIDRISICAGTHNEKSSLYLVKLMEEKTIPASDKRIYFAQLLGMSDHISYNLAKAAYNVAKYVPYGPVKEVLPYLIRRAEENTSVSGQTSRELSLIIKEKERRKKK
jgi:proline dehydrogenase